MRKKRRDWEREKYLKSKIDGGGESVKLERKMSLPAKQEANSDGAHGRGGGKEEDELRSGSGFPPPLFTYRDHGFTVTDSNSTRSNQLSQPESLGLDRVEVESASPKKRNKGQLASRSRRRARRVGHVSAESTLTRPILRTPIGMDVKLYFEKL